MMCGRHLDASVLGGPEGVVVRDTFGRSPVNLSERLELALLDAKGRPELEVQRRPRGLVDALHLPPLASQRTRVR